MALTTEKNEFDHWAFISYVREDEKFAKWLQKNLESFPIPLEYVGNKTGGRGHQVPFRVAPIFLDTSDLNPDASAKEAVTAELLESRYLVVVCSPRVLKSTWVLEEIEYFKSLGRGNRIFAVVIEGEPGASWKLEVSTGKHKFDPTLECLPDGLHDLLKERQEGQDSTFGPAQIPNLGVAQIPDGVSRVELEGGFQRQFLAVDSVEGEGRITSEQTPNDVASVVKRLDFRDEPLAIDCRKFKSDRRQRNKKHALKVLVAALSGLKKDKVVRWREKAERWAKVSASVVAIAAIAVLGSLLIFALKQRNAALEANHDLEEMLDYMVGDLSDSLEKAGRIDILEGPLDRIEDYLNENRKKNTSAIRSRIGIRRGEIEFKLGNITEGIELIRRQRDLADEELAKFERDNDGWLAAVKRFGSTSIETERDFRIISAEANMLLSDYYAWLTGSGASARNCVIDAIDQWSILRQEFPKTWRYRIALAEARNYLADLEGEYGNTEKALQLYRSAEAELFSDFEKGTMIPDLEEITQRDQRERFRISMRGRIRSSKYLNQDLRFEEAMKELDSVKAVLLPYFEEHSADVMAIELLKDYWLSRGWCYRGLLNTEREVVSFNKAREFQNVLIETEPRNQHYIRGEAQLKSEVAITLVDFDKQEEMLKDAVQISEKGLRVEPGSIAWRKHLVNHYRGMGNFYRSNMKLDLAEGWFRKAIGIADESNPSEHAFMQQAAADSRIDLAQILLEELRKGESPGITGGETGNDSACAEADRLALKASALYQGASSDSGSVVATDRHVAVALEVRGDASSLKGDLKAAEGFFRQAYELRQKLLAREELGMRDLIAAEIVVSYQKLARTRREEKCFSDAIDYYDKAIELQNEIVKSKPENRRSRLDLVNLTKSKALTLKNEWENDDRVNGQRRRESIQTFQQSLCFLQQLMNDSQNHPDYLRNRSFIRLQIAALVSASPNEGEIGDAAEQALFEVNLSWEDFHSILKMKSSGDPRRNMIAVKAILDLKANLEKKVGDREERRATLRLSALTMSELAAEVPRGLRAYAEAAEATRRYAIEWVENGVRNKADKTEIIGLLREAILRLDDVGQDSSDLATQLRRIRDQIRNVADNQ